MRQSILLLALLCVVAAPVAHADPVENPALSALEAVQAFFSNLMEEIATVFSEAHEEPSEEPIPQIYGGCDPSG